MGTRDGESQTEGFYRKGRSVLSHRLVRKTVLLPAPPWPAGIVGLDRRACNMEDLVLGSRNLGVGLYFRGSS